MASIKVPSNVTSMTFTTSGVKVPVAGIISGLTPLEGNLFSHQGNNTGNRIGPAKLMRTAANGNISISVPVLISSITIDSVVYAVGGAVTPFGRELTNPVPAVAGSQFLYENFSLVQG